MSHNIRRKTWCFTLNNYSDEEYSRICEHFRNNCRYFIIGKEIGDQGTPHLQGYCVFKTQYLLTTIKDKFSSRAHWEAAKGTGDHNYVYCSKGGDVIEEGDLSLGKGKGAKRKNRDELAVEWRSALARGRSGITEFADANPGVYAWSGHTLLRNSLGLTGAISRPNIRVRWIWGAPGVGKSRFAHEQAPDAYVKDPRTKWWTGYLLEKDVIIDDFGPNGIDINHLLRWFDRYKCYVETKGDMCALLADNFIVTSNFIPADVFKDKEGVPHPQIPALLRRVELIEFN